MNGELIDISSLPKIVQYRISAIIPDGENARIFLQSNIDPIQQTGPTCGLVALTMSLKKLGLNISVSDCLEGAINAGFSKQGEMFSANNLSTLANSFLPECSNVQDFPSSAEIVKALLSGSQFIIPYDCDKNFSAANKNGHKAHWLLLCGFLLKADRIDDDDPISPEVLNESDPLNLILLGYQGKSKTLGIFPYEDLRISNGQLQEADPVRSEDEMIIGDTRDLSQLRNKVVQIFTK